MLCERPEVITAGRRTGFVPEPLLAGGFNVWRLR
jgi:hypothetical protein